ncbi:acetyl-CoA hydrolase/transferase C-terminal domain-containing protein [Spirochaeta isovalerica]|uniref:Acyl-CoA hydrolase n=1 Tax=Spirochaeta isovalerica TaxID=150 RepID=A0A841RHP9_9SPIO|nr:acyl-CoA hydrolase [Spirochaeta isovalerica]
MTDWKKEYEKKYLSMEEAIGKIPRKASVVVGMASMESQGFMGEIHKHAEKFDFLRVNSCLNFGHYPFCENPESEGVFCNDNWFFGPSTRAAQKAGYRIVDYIPNNLHAAGMDRIVSFKEDGDFVVYWGAVSSMMEKSGFFSLGLSNVYEQEVIEMADMVILEVNDKVPVTHGDTQIHMKDVDYIVEYSKDLPTIGVLEPSDVEKTIAGHIAELVEDGATLQVGIGGIPNAVCGLLSDKKDLGIHTEMFTESMIDLFEAGVITNKKKTLWPGKFICTFALGSQRMYDWLADNPAVLILRGSYVNDPYVISQNDNMVSINTAISVDLTGQVCSESLGTVQYSGTGGQLDTHRGAVMSKGGKGIIALRSTAKGGTLSTITAVLAEGAKVTVPRQDIDYVVTEYGVAHLRGGTIAQRVKALIAIAHPDFRDRLTDEARKLKYI